MMNRNRAHGFSLIEIMAAMLVLGILFGGTAILFYQSVKIELLAEDRARANNLGRAAVEDVKQIDWGDIPLDETGSGELVPGDPETANSYYTADGQYHVLRTITEPIEDVKRITVNVFAIDSPGSPGEQEESAVTFSTDIYKFGM